MKAEAQSTCSLRAAGVGNSCHQALFGCTAWNVDDVCLLSDACDVKRVKPRYVYPYGLADESEEMPLEHGQGRSQLEPGRLQVPASGRPYALSVAHVQIHNTAWLAGARLGRSSTFPNTLCLTG